MCVSAEKLFMEGVLMPSESVMEELFRGRIHPWERHQTAQKEASIRDAIADEFDYFHTILSPEDYERFENLDSLFSNISTETELAAFKYALTFGIRLMAEAFSDFRDFNDARDE